MFLGHLDPTSPLGRVTYGGALAVAVYLLVLVAAVSAALLLLRFTEARRMSADPAFVEDPTVRSTPVSVLVRPKVAVGQAVVPGPGVTGLLGAERGGRTGGSCG